MRLIDFLILLLEAQAQTLKRLAAFFGEEDLLQILELAGEKEDDHLYSAEIDPDWFESPPVNDSSTVYSQLEGSVREFNLPSVLEFHLWAYPFYRSFIESSVDLRSKIRCTGPRSADAIITEALTQSDLWIKHLPFPPGVILQAERAAQVPWIRFRSEVYKKLGKRPFATV
jgi:hypothetical protein